MIYDYMMIYNIYIYIYIPLNIMIYNVSTSCQTP